MHAFHPFILNVADVVIQLDSGRNNARGVDLAGIKVSVTQWRRWTPAIPPKNKSVQGMNHPEIRRLFCPIPHDPFDPVYVLLFP